MYATEFIGPEGTIVINPRLKNLCDDILKLAKKEVESGQNVSSGAFFITEDNDFLAIPFELEDEESKEITHKMLKKVAEDQDAIIAGTILEAFSVTRTEEELKRLGPPTFPLKDDDDVLESVVLSVETHTGYWTGVAVIKETEDGKTFEVPDMKYQLEVKGLFTNILPTPLDALWQ